MREIAAMGLSDPKGAFGETLARYYHQSESRTVATSWPQQSTFAITRLRSEVGLPDVSQAIPEEAAIHVSIAIQPVPPRTYELHIDGRRIEVPYIPAYRTSIIDLESHPICTVDCGFDYVHYHVPREGLDEIARDHKIKPVGTFKFGICEDDLVIAQLTKNILPHVGSAEMGNPLALDHFSLMFGAHLLQAYGGVARLPDVTARGLAPWQQLRATELLREHLDGGVNLSEVARECGMSLSHFARSFRASFGVSAYRWLLLQRIERAKRLMLATQATLGSIALEAGFSDQSSFNRTFRQFVGTSPGRWRQEITGE
jgi:AraC family transcriptional regulator